MEAEYRKQIQVLFDEIEKSLEGIDPDVIECEQTLGALTLTLVNKTRCILSAQPSVRQLWLAVAAQGTAYHFNFNPQTQTWMDDKGLGVEPKSFLKKYLLESTGIELPL